MPYMLKGSAVYHKKGGRWVKKQQAKSHENAMKAMRLLEAIEHTPGFKPRDK